MFKLSLQGIDSQHQILLAHAIWCTIQKVYDRAKITFFALRGDCVLLTFRDSERYEWSGAPPSSPPAAPSAAPRAAPAAPQGLYQQ
eukprot:1160162-Pelagomonas_calceolata.AAC.1